MKTNSIILTVALVIASLAAILAISCSKQMSETVSDEEIGYNGGFEQIENNIPVNWLVYTPETTGSGDFDISADTQNRKEGKQSLKFDVRSCSDKGGRFSPGVSQERRVDAGDNFKISFWTKNQGAAYLIRIHAVSATKQAGGIELKSEESSNDWVYHEYQYTIPEKMNKLRFECNVLVPGTFWLDDVSIIEQSL